MARKTHVLIVDDALVARRLLESVFAEEKDLQVVASARNGQEALNILKNKPVDIVILDVDMPVMDGLETLKQIKKIDKTIPVIMFSSLTHRGAEATLKALFLGAADYFHKPSGDHDIDASLAVVRTQMLPKIREMILSGKIKIKGGAALPDNLPGKALDILAPRSFQRVEIIVIGVSTGGPLVLGDFFEAMPNPLPIPIFIVQHMPPMFTNLLAERLNDTTPFHVREAIHGARPKAGEVWLAPGDFHMEITHDKTGPLIQLNQNPPENFCRPSVDVLFRSAAKAYGKNVLGVILTGMGRDGLAGAKEITSKGGKVLVQDQASSVVWSMPQAIVEEGIAEDVLPPAGLAIEVFRRTLDGRVKPG